MEHSFFDIDKLKVHEQISPSKVRRIVNGIRKTGMIRPLLVEKDFYIVLDGHHRLAALKKLGHRKAPVILVNYFSMDVDVILRRKNIINNAIKMSVIGAALSNRPFPSKTTRHNLRVVENRFEKVKL